jgi:DNA mismatch endonuclease (patch repair protein)
MPSKAGITPVMRGNRRVDTRPEVVIRSALHRLGYRFRKNAPVTVAGLRVRPDIVFPGRKIAVFVDGCYWHRCPIHGTAPGANKLYWQLKLDGNVARDGRVNSALRRAGWRVVRIWEHSRVEEAVTQILPLLERSQGERLTQRK